MLESQGPLEVFRSRCAGRTELLQELNLDVYRRASQR
jgi:hypothetical protein